MRDSFRLVPMGIGVALSLIPVSALAGPPPTSARSQALGVNPLLLDDMGVVFQLPHKAVDLENQVTVLGQGASSTTSSVGAVAGGEHRVVLLTQVASVGGIQQGRVYGLGWATTWSGFDLGVGLSGGRDLDKWTSDERRYDSDGSSSVISRLSERETKLLEGQIGVGSRRGDSFFDIALGFTGSREKSETIDVFGTSRTANFRNGEVRMDPLATVRVGNTSDGSAVVLAGTWGRATWDTSVSSTSATDQGVQKGAAQREDTANIWSARALLSRETPRGLVGLHLGYSHNEVPALSVWTSGTAVREDYDRTRQGVASLGVWVDAEVVGPLRVLGGAAGSYRRNEEETGFVFYDNAGNTRTQSSISENELLASSFSWGATVETERYRAVAMLDTRLDLENLFWVLDLSYLF